MKKNIVLLAAACIMIMSACTGRKPDGEQVRQMETSQQDKPAAVLVFIPGVTAGSPPYEMLVEGAQEFAAEHGNVMVKVYEAGFNQAEWEEQLRSMVAGGEYDLVLTTNPSLPEICANVGSQFPHQKFIITDAMYQGHPQIGTYLYNQYEQALLLGYLAGLITTGAMPLANSEKRIGFIASQEYPLLSRHMIPGFLDGARRVDPAIELDFRVIGNWYDANKAADLASAMINTGVDVITSIAGGAAQGILRVIKERSEAGGGGAYAVSFNINEYNQAPGLIVGCGIMEQKKLIKEILSEAAAGTLPYGTGKIVGVKDGYINFIDNDSGYLNFVPPETRERFDAFMDDIRAGRVAYTVPPL